jgi:hypothetical protein
MLVNHTIGEKATATTLISGTMVTALGPPLTLFLTPLAPRRPHDSELLFLARAVQNATLSFATFSAKLVQNMTPFRPRINFLTIDLGIFPL